MMQKMGKMLVLTALAAIAGTLQAAELTAEQKATNEYMQDLSKKFQEKVPTKIFDGMTLTKTSVDGTVFILEYKLDNEKITKYLKDHKLVNGDTKLNAEVLGEDTLKYLCSEVDIDEPIPFISKGGSMRLEYKDSEGKALATMPFDPKMCSQGYGKEQKEAS